MLSKQFPQILFYYPVHLNPNIPESHDILAGLSNVHLAPPLPYDELIYLMSKSFIILTDQVAYREEAPSLNVPVLVMQESTERPEGIENGCSKLVGANAKKITETFHELINVPASYQQMAAAINPYGDGKSAARIADIILSEV